MDLTTSYMGLELRNPLIASASPLNRDLDTLRALEHHGAAAVVLPSIFEEQIVAERREFERRSEVSARRKPIFRPIAAMASGRSAISISCAEPRRRLASQ